MRITVTAARALDVRAEVLLVPVIGDAVPELAPGIDSDALADAVRRSRFTGAFGEDLLVAGGPDDAFGVAMLLGVGPREGLGPDRLRDVTTRAIGRIARFTSVATTLPQSVVGGSSGGADESGAVAEGALLGLYEVLRSSGKPASIEELVLILPPDWNTDEAQSAVAAAEIVTSSVNWARELIDRPANDLSPYDLADAAREMAGQSGLDVRIHDVDALTAGGFGGLLAVGGGSYRPPCLIELRHTGTAPRSVALVGKGIVFDSGGLLLKQKDSMAAMRSDMAGAATVFAAIGAAAKLGCTTSVVAVGAAAENMPSGRSYRPGDVIRHRGGITSEVIDTDAEGRVVLADALAYVSESRPDSIVDVATLTYDVIKALGDEVTGILGTDQPLVDELIAAGRAENEPLWQLPLWPGYRRNIDSPVARVRNDGGNYADAIHAAHFLAEFTGGIPWAHLDVGGTAFVEKTENGRPVGSTGTGIRTLVRWLRR